MNRKLSSMEDIDLVILMRKSKRDSEAAFKELYNRHASMVNAYCMRAINNEEAAEDIFQETFIKFYQKVRADNPKNNIPGFLITIARNLCLNHKRDKRQMVSIDKLEFMFKDYQSYEDKELLDLITRSLELIEDDYREAFVLREYSNLPYNDIAEILDITVSNAKSRVFRAKKKIKAVLQPYLDDLKKNT